MNSLWLDDPKIKRFPKLEDDLECDVLVIGGGITGITCALNLIDEGFIVALVDADRLMHGVTGYTTAKVTIQHGILYKNLIKKFGVEKAKLYADSNTRAIQMMKDNIENYQIDCDYEDVTAYLYTTEDKYVNNIEQEYEAAQKLEIDSILTDDLGLPFPIKKAVGFKNQGQFHPIKYLHKLIEEFDRNDDSYIFEASKVIDITEDNNFCHTHMENGVKVKSRHVVVASHYPVNDKYNFYFAKLKPSSSYLIAAKSDFKMENMHCINVEKPTRSLRSQVYNDERLLIIGGENHQTGHTKVNSSHFDKLEEFGKEYFQISEPLFRWSTQDFNTFDQIPYIGRINTQLEHVYVATGFKKWGMTTSHVAAMIIRDLITKKHSEYLDLYKPQRMSDKVNFKFVKYNLCSVKHLISDRFKNVSKEFDVSYDEGKIVSYKGKKYGAYRDKEGKLYIVDVVCPHLKCILKFNNERKTYDCPCHGSRFTYKGKYIDGPSIKDLKRINFKNLS